MVPSGSMACKRLAPSDPNRMEGECLSLRVPSEPLPAPPHTAAVRLRQSCSVEVGLGGDPRILWEPGVCRAVSAQTAPMTLQQPLQLGQVRAAFCLLRPLGQGRGGASSPGQQRPGSLSRVRWTPQPLSSLLAPFPPVLGSSLVWAQQMVGWGVGGAPRTSGRALCGPQPARSSLPHRQ